VRELHLFAGIGGGILGGMLLGHECVGAVEFDPYCREVLRARQADGCIPLFPVMDDVRTFDGAPWRGKVDVICGGFPCQPWSTAGKQLGTADHRHLWPEMARIIAEVRPRYVFAENVTMAAFEEPWRDLRRMGYRVPPAICVSASDVGAPHLRKRWWLLAIDSDGLDDGAQRGVRHTEIETRGPAEVGPKHEGTKSIMARPANGYSNGSGKPTRTVDDEAPLLPGVGNPNGAKLATAIRTDWWATEPRFRRVAHGVPKRMGRLKALGNAQVPLVAAEAFRLLMAQDAQQ